MCDYSLHGIPNRLATEGEELIVHRFATGTIGLCAAADLGTANRLQPRPASFWGWVRRFFEGPPSAAVPAVCIPPGADLILKDIPRDLQRQWGVGPEQRVRFTQLTAAPHMHRDALRLPSGQEVVLQRVREDLRVQVLSLGGDYDPVEVTPEAVGRPSW